MATRSGSKAVRRQTSAARPANKVRSYGHAISLNKRGIVGKQRSLASKKLKPRAHSKRQGHSLRETVIREFKESVEQTHQQITKEVSEALATVERDSKLRLKNVMLARNKKLEQFRTRTDASLAPFRQTAATGTPKQEGDGSSSFLKRCERFRDMVDEKADSLRNDWKEWGAIHQEIFCLGVEILGPQGIYNNSRSCEVPRKVTHDSESTFNDAIAFEEDVQETRRQQSKEIGLLTKDLQKRLAAQEKQSQDEKKSRRDQMVQLARQMMAGL